METPVKQRLLVIDDEESLRHMLSVLLKRQGYRVDTAADGSEGLALAQKGRYDFILCDIKMPVMDGIEAACQILSEMPGMKILALSMYTDNGFIEGMMHAGARGYIAKDSDPEELYKAIRQAAGPGNS